MKRALIAFLLCTPVLASTPNKPMAECSQGKCVIAEADWKQFQEFHKQTRKRMGQVNEEMVEQNRTMNGLLGQLMECRSRLPEREV